MITLRNSYKYNMFRTSAVLENSRNIAHNIVFVINTTLADF